jgi:hypothetical protein
MVALVRSKIRFCGICGTQFIGFPCQCSVHQLLHFCYISPEAGRVSPIMAGLRNGLSLINLTNRLYIYKYIYIHIQSDRFCGLVVRVPGYRSRGAVSIPGATTFSEKQWVWNGVYSASWVQLRSYLKEKFTAPVQKSENTVVEIRHADHVAPFIRKSWH